MISAATTYAVRSLGRNRRRTWLSIVGIGIGCALALTMESMNRGRDELFARMGAYAGSGHVRVVPARWNERRDPRLRLDNWQADLRAAESLPGVAAVAVRARSQALIAMGTRVSPVELVGVDPAREPAADRFVRTVTRGRYLTPSDSGAIVVGKAVADRLAADLDDEILATAVGRNGDIESTMLRIVGIVDTGSDEIDAGICQVPLADIERLTGLAGAGEVAIVLKDWKASDTTRATLARSLSGGDLALTWGDISPELKGHLEQDKAMSRAIGAVILLIVFLGVASAQLAAVLERRREFAVLLALGMQGRLMALLLLVEAVAVGGSGAVLGLALGLPIVWRLARVGLDLSTWLGSNYTFQGVVIEPIFYGDIGWWVLWYVFTVAVGATIVASLYPAWFASRTNAADALRVA